jgi:hypothetical protein
MSNEMTSGLEIVKGEYKFYCGSVLAYFVITVISSAIIFVGTHKYPALLDLSIVIKFIYFIAWYTYLRGTYRLATHLKINNMTRTQPWLWVIGSLIPIICFIVILRMFGYARKLLKELCI